MLLLELVELYCSTRLSLADGSAEQLRIAVRLMDRWRGRPTELDDLDEDDTCRWLKWLLKQGRSPATVNSRRRALLTLWRDAADRDLVRMPRTRRIGRVTEPKRNPQAWTVDQVGRLLRACRSARTIRCWTPAHWEALVLVCYDTASRIGAVLAAARDQWDGEWILLAADDQKSKRDELKRLAPQTIEALKRLPHCGMRLFPWPLKRKQIWTHWRRIVIAAGLQPGRKSGFHRLRRTSYTLVYRALGPDAASAHAGHQQDLSRHYLDQTKLDLPDVLQALPRPAV